MAELQDTLGTPTQVWWAQAQMAFRQVCQILTHDINNEGPSRVGKPRITILPSGTFGCGLSSVQDMLDCTAFGSIRKELFIEVAWQNITSEEYRDVEIKVYETSKRRLLLEISGFLFRVHYIECPELLKTHPEVIDSPEEFRSTLRAEVDDAVQSLQELELWSNYTREVPVLRRLYYVLKASALSLGLYAENDISCFDANSLQEFTYKTMLDREHVDYGNMDIFAVVCLFLSRHKTCHQLVDEKCPFDVDEIDSRLSGTKRWSSKQFRIAHEGLRCLQAKLDESREQTGDNWFHNLLKEFQNQQISQTMGFEHFIQITMQYSGRSQLEGTKMMDFVEGKVMELKESLEKLPKLDFRIWPERLVEASSTVDDSPYEGLWLIGISIKDRGLEYSTVESGLVMWNSEVHADCRYSPLIMFVQAELVSQDLMVQQDLRKDPRKWPLPLAQPGQNMGLDPAKRGSIKVTQSLPVAGAKSSRKLRPAMEVLSRLRHDPSFELDDFAIGYTDRHSGIEEREARKWVVESTNDEWIPQSRIQYFKRISDGEVVWDRASKTDSIFKTQS